jgi:peptidoglycan hydrolase-like protein with peptidoglycan-binding domain
MSNDKLAEQLGKLKEACAKWEKELETYKKWALENDGVISMGEMVEITRRLSDIIAIKARIAQIEQAKGLQKEEAPKNKLGITKEQVKDKLSNYFAAFDKFTVVVGGKTVEVETPYFMNDGTAGGNWDGNNVNAGKGSPKEVQKWLQDRIDKGKVTTADPAKLRQYLKDNKIGVDCSGFVSQALNHVADKEGDMEYGADDVFTPDGRGSGSFGPSGKEFKKIEPANVAIGDTLYFKNAPGKVNHIRIVGDVRTENGVVYYTIFESAGSTGPRKMEWKFEGGKLQEYNGNTWAVKTSETFYRWKELDMEVPTGGGSGQGQQQDQQQNNTGTTETTVTSTTLSASVGKGGKNKKADVMLVQELLNKKGASLKVDGDCGNMTNTAIGAFQKKEFGWSDGLVDPGGQTWNKLSGGAISTPTDVKEVKEEETETNNNTESNNNTDAGTAKFTGNIKKPVGKAQPNELNDVFTVQTLLKKQGYKVPVDGKYEATTETAIGEFQKSLGMVKPDFVISPKGNTITQLFLKNLPPLGLPADIKTASATIPSDPQQATIKQDVVIAAGSGHTISSPVLVVIGGMHGWTGSKMLKHTPSSVFAKAVVIAAGYTATWKDIEKAYQTHFKTTNALNMGTCGAVGFSAGGSTLYKWGFTKFKKCGLADPYITTDRAKGLGSNCILSCNFVDWHSDRTTPEGIMKAALEKGAFAEETKIPHGEYPAYFLSQFAGDLI